MSLPHGCLYRIALARPAGEHRALPLYPAGRAAVMPGRVTAIRDLATALADADVELRVLPSLEPLIALWRTSLHDSGIRLRNMSAS